mmetsp:Transcript_21708/g.32309  ORF Transcript_21708/g.32309 Transcript_21708/m.32309 type:complete len:241 (-) Transcript_21708:62-784(-)
MKTLLLAGRRLGDGRGVQYWKTSVDTATKQFTPLPCSDVNYEISLYIAPGSAHIYMNAFPRTKEISENQQHSCQAYSFDSVFDKDQGNSKRMSKIDVNAFAKVDGVTFNLKEVRALSKIVAAFEAAETHPEEEYDPASHNCGDFIEDMCEKLEIPVHEQVSVEQVATAVLLEWPDMPKMIRENPNNLAKMFTLQQLHEYGFDSTTTATKFVQDVLSDADLVEMVITFRFMKLETALLTDQ